MKLVEAQRTLGVKADGRWGDASARALVRALPDRPSLLSVQLSEHVTLGEMLASDTARVRGLRNIPTASQLLAMVALCVNIVEPVRAEFGRPVRITSGFRIFTPTSQHGKGEALDFEVVGVPNLTVARWILTNLVFDQLILEAWKAGEDPNAGWIHCSFRVDRARRSVLRTPTGKAPYFAGLPAGD